MAEARQRTLLIPEIHPGNVLYYRLLARFMRIEALFLHPACVRTLGSRIRIVDRNILSYEEALTFRRRLVERWTQVRAWIAEHDWTMKYQGLKLDFFANAGQDLWKSYEALCLLGEVQRRREGAALVVHSRRSWFLSTGPVGREEFERARTTRLMSRLHIALDAAWETIEGIATATAALIGLATAFVSRLRPSADTLGRIPVVYLCDNLNDLDDSREKRSFRWLVDGQHIQSEDVLFVLPNNRDSRLQRFAHLVSRTSFQGGTLPQLYRCLPASVLTGAIGDMLWSLPRLALAVFADVPRKTALTYKSSVMRLGPVIRHVRPSGCVETDSSLSIESPVLEYLDKLGVETFMCQLSSLIPYHTDCDGSPCKDFLYSGIIARKVLCWNEQALNFMDSHPQVGTQFEVVGPVMAADDAVLSEDRASLRRQLSADDRTAALGDRPWVVMFDNLPTRKAALQRRPYQTRYTEDHWLGFVRDAVRLLSDLPDIVLVYKPKRGHGKGSRFKIADWFPLRSQEYESLVAQLETHERAFILEEDVNTLATIGAADVCLAVPGSSPVCAAWHFGVPGLYHDPLGHLGARDHGPVRKLFTQSYEELRAGVRFWLDVTPRDRTQRLWNVSGIGPYIGHPAGSNANAACRDLLKRPAPHKPASSSVDHTGPASLADAGGSIRKSI
jgi:polysaccharide biosynthesis PFTS motif protein